jgi:hypothetical protein
MKRITLVAALIAVLGLYFVAILRSVGQRCLARNRSIECSHAQSFSPKHAFRTYK